MEPTSQSHGPTRWTIPVNPAKWPPIRWVVQFVGGLFLALLFGVAFVGIQFMAATIVFGLVVGLCLAAMLNGLLVGRRRRR